MSKQLLFLLAELRAQLFGSRKRTIFRERQKMNRALWLKVMFAYGWRCARCGDRRELQVDHIRALATGGRTEWGNLPATPSLVATAERDMMCNFPD